MEKTGDFLYNGPMNIPDHDKCLQILHEYGTPEHVIGHCTAVAMTALCIGRALNEKGYHLDLDLILAAGLLHDIARVHPRHELVGADFLVELGYPEVADIVRVHMSYPAFHTGQEIDETDLVCLGDRVCKFDKYVGVDDRMEYIIDKHGRTPEVEKHIYSHKHVITDFIDELEEIIGEPINDVLKQDPNVPYAVPNE